MRLRSAVFRLKNVFGLKIPWKSALRTRILFASTGVMHDFPVHIDIKNTYQIRTEK